MNGSSFNTSALTLSTSAMVILFCVMRERAAKPTRRVHLALLLALHSFVANAGNMTLNVCTCTCTHQILVSSCWMVDRVGRSISIHMHLHASVLRWLCAWLSALVNWGECTFDSGGFEHAQQLYFYSGRVDRCAKLSKTSPKHYKHWLLVITRLRRAYGKWTLKYDFFFYFSIKRSSFFYQSIFKPICLC